MNIISGYLKYLYFAVLMGFLSGCIHNDLPYPKIQQNITKLVAYGESAATTIDTESLTATVYLAETVDIEKVYFTQFSITEGGMADPDLSVGYYNLSSPLVVSITGYQTYQWLVKAEQNIERYFTIEGQIGESVIDAVGHRVLVSVPESFNLSQLKVTSIKLGPEGISQLSPDVVAGGAYDFSRPFRIDVTAFGRSEEWTIYVEKTEQTVATENAVPGSRVIWVWGSCPSDVKGGFQYKKSSDDEVSYYKGKDATLLKMDLKKYDDTQLEFVAIMPEENLSDYIDDLKIDDVNKMIEKSKKASETKGGLNIYIPKFSFQYNLELKSDLINLGITEAFNDILADFSNMSSSIEGLYVSDALHKANIDFTEKGIKAAAVTVLVTMDSAVIAEPTKPEEIKIDKPFLYIIRDKDTGEIWFVGTVYEPNSWENDKADYEYR